MRASPNPLREQARPTVKCDSCGEGGLHFRVLPGYLDEAYELWHHESYLCPGSTTYAVIDGKDWFSPEEAASIIEAGVPLTTLPARSR